MLVLCHELGLLVNVEKSDLVPRQIFDFVGYHYDLILYTVCPTQHNWGQMIRKVSPLLRGELLPVRRWQSIIGFMSSQEKIIPFDRLHPSQLQLHLLREWSPSPGDQLGLI